eukprot:3932491-Rhodomonas_salina.4
MEDGADEGGAGPGLEALGGARDRQHRRQHALARSGAQADGLAGGVQGVGEGVGSAEGGGGAGGGRLLQQAPHQPCARLHRRQRPGVTQQRRRRRVQRPRLEQRQPVRRRDRRQLSHHVTRLRLLPPRCAHARTPLSYNVSRITWEERGEGGWRRCGGGVGEEGTCARGSGARAAIASVSPTTSPARPSPSSCIPQPTR